MARVFWLENVLLKYIGANMVKILKAIITLLVVGAAASGFLAKLAEKHQHEPTAGGSSSYAPPPSSTMEWNSMNLYTGGGSSSTAASQQQPGASMRGQMRSQEYCHVSTRSLVYLPFLVHTVFLNHGPPWASRFSIRIGMSL